MTHELHLQDKFLIPFFREGLGYRKVKPNTVTLSASLFHLMRAWRVISTTLTDQATGQVTMQATDQATMQLPTKLPCKLPCKLKKCSNSV